MTGKLFIVGVGPGHGDHMTDARAYHNGKI